MKVIEIISHSQACNTYIVESDNYSIIIDCGAKIEEAKKLITKPVCAILLSHGHFDHIFELEEYYREFNCPIYGGRKIGQKLGDFDKNLSSKFCDFKVKINSNTLDKLKEISDEDITCGDIKVTCISLQGHSECGMGYLIENHLFCGDTLFEKCVGRYDLYDSSFSMLRASLRKIESLKTITHLHPGHGRSFTK